MANWLISREALKRAGDINGASKDAILDRVIEAVSQEIERATHRYFIPRTETRLYRWPPGQTGRSYILWLDQDLLSLTTLKTKAQDSSPTTIVAADYFLEPANFGPPYDRIEIDLSSDSAFEAGDTPQRSISVLGSWGFSNTTKAAGTVSSGLASDAAAVSMVCSDGSLIDVGDTLLIGTEQIFVSARANAQVGSQTISSALTADRSEVTVGVGDGTLFKAGEVILIDSERMYIESITSNNLTVIRAYDGSLLAAHTNATAVHAFRTLTIVRGVNGTTAAVHADAVAITKYTPPLAIQQLALREAIAMYQQQSSGEARVIGTGEGQTEFSGKDLSRYRKEVMAEYRRTRMGVI